MKHGGAVAVSRGVEAVERGGVGVLTSCTCFLGKETDCGRAGENMSVIITLSG